MPRAPWLLVWDDHEVANDYAGLQGQTLQPDFAEQRAAAYQAYWEHMPFPHSARPRGPDMRITGRLDWGRLARIHLLDDRQYRDVQVCPKPGRGGSNSVRPADCPAAAEPAAQPARRRAGALARRRLGSAAAVEPGRTADADGAPTRRATRPTAAAATGPTAGTAIRRRAERLLDGVAARAVPGVVVLGGDVHANHVADLKVDFDDERAPVVATEFCGTSISSSGGTQAKLDATRPFNPHIRHARSDQRGYVRFALDRARLQAWLRVVEQPLDPASSLATQARFDVEAARPGAVEA